MSLRLGAIGALLAGATALGALAATAPRARPNVGGAAGVSAAARRMDSRFDADGSNATCRNLGAAPFYRHEPLVAQELGGEYPLKDGDFDRFHVRGRYPQLEEFLAKLATGEKVTIATLGGSFTYGMDCRQGRMKEQACAWVGRFTFWLQSVFPKADLRFQYWNRGGTASCPHSLMLPIALKAFLQEGNQLDLLLVDTNVNGLFEPEQDAYCYEQILRTVHELSPNTALFGLLVGPPKKHTGKVLNNLISEEGVLLHYGVPYVNFVKMTLDRPELWILQRGSAEVHPSWKTHQMVADSVANVFGKVLASAARCPSSAPAAGNGARTTWPEKTYWAESLLAQHQPCVHPVSSYSATEKQNWNGADLDVQPEVLRGNWSLYADRPNKPGWISTELGSKIRFNVTFGAKPNLLIVYLRSYKGLGPAFLNVTQPPPVYRKHPMHLHTLDGKWEQKVSQAAIYRLVEGFQALFFLPPNGTATVTFENRGSKFKILSIFSC